MTLLTPPSSSHRSDKDKENKFLLPVAGPSTRTVAWASKNSFHLLSTPPKPPPSSKQQPQAPKSILKKSNLNAFLSLPVDTGKEREVTPEPSDPLVNLHYLNHPVEQILSTTNEDGKESLGKLIEGYNVLAARLRASVSDATDADASWPLFQPLRKNAPALVSAIVRDLGRALVDPLAGAPASEEECLPKFTLPSPQSSPAKKKGGMTAEQVKYARDLCTTCHSVIRLLNVVLSLPAIYTVFQERQLRQILTAILAIPLADSLPTPNSRKTCALAIGLIQGQRLPAEVLQPAADRIAYALRRGLDGELGKEGKKGSANDGLKAIHDLCAYLPGVFLPAFTPLLPSVLSNLLAPTLVLRTQACHALGGFVLAATSIPLSSAHTIISSAIAAHITALPTPKKASDSPTKQAECQIVRTLRTTMTNADPTHVAQGPVWAICVLASFVVLLGSRVCTDSRANRIISSLLSLGMRSKKSSVRALTCLAWRTMTWAYFQPPLPVDSDEESEVDDEERAKSKNARQVHRKVMTSVVDCHAGIASIAALLRDESAVGDEPVRLSLSILQQMAAKAGSTCLEAVDAMGHIVSRPYADLYETEEGWDKNLLIPKGLFDAVPGLLTTEFKNLSGAVRPIFDNGVIVNDIRCLTREEMSKEWVFNGVIAAWRTALGALEMWDDAEVPANIVDVWSGLLKANVAHLQDNDDDDVAISRFASSAIKHVTEILESPELNFRPKKIQTPSKSDTIPDSDDTILDIETEATCSNGELRLRVVESLWTAMRRIIPLSSLREAGETLLACIMRNDDSLLADNARLSGSAATEADEEGGQRARNAWVTLCVDIITVCDPEAVRVFWACEEDAPVRSQKGTWGWNWTKEFTNAVWKTFVQWWKRREGHWEGGVVLLGVPFTDRHAWTIGSDDFALWENLLSFTSNKALDDGIDTCTVLDTTASFVSCFQTPGAVPDASTRLVDLLFSHLDAADMRDVPLNLLELASETMRATYPPEPRNKPVMMWLARSLMRVIEHCPEELCLRLLQSLQEGLCLWLGDECNVWTEDDILYDIVPLYQHILVSIQVLPSTLTTLEALGGILASIFRTRVLPLAAEAFVAHWKLEYAQVPTPTAGWPEPIRHSLRSVGLLPAEVEEHASSSSTVCPSTPLAASFSLPPAPFPSSSSSCFSTPTRSPDSKRDPLSQIPSPQRPQKPFGAYPAVPSSPVSPLRSRKSSTSSTSSSYSHRRVPLSPVQPRRSPLKRRRLNAKDEESDEEDKENANVDTPSRINGPKLVSVAERIAQILKQPKSTPSPVANMKKRRLDEEKEEGVKDTPVSAKRLKTKMRPRSGLVKKAVVPAIAPVAIAVPFPSVESTAEKQAQDVFSHVQPRLTVPLPKRKREDGIIGVSVAPKMHSTSMDSQAITTPRKIDLTKVARLRRSVSIPESLLLTLGTAAPRKRKRTESDIGRSSDQPLPSIQQLADAQHAQVQQTPTRLGGRTMTLRERHAMPTMWRTCSAPVSMTLQLSDDPAQDAMDAPAPSSDDDPHLGQVTPHHLISPAMQRKGFGAARTPSLKGLFGDGDEEDDEDMEMPGSGDSAASDDSADSNESDSPTKEFVSRQLRRMGSESRFFKASPGVSV